MFRHVRRHAALALQPVQCKALSDDVAELLGRADLAHRRQELRVVESCDFVVCGVHRHEPPPERRVRRQHHEIPPLHAHHHALVRPSRATHEKQQQQQSPTSSSVRSSSSHRRGLDDLAHDEPLERAVYCRATTTRRPSSKQLTSFVRAAGTPLTTATSAPVRATTRRPVDVRATYAEAVGAKSSKVSPFAREVRTTLSRFTNRNRASNSRNVTCGGPKNDSGVSSTLTRRLFPSATRAKGAKPERSSSWPPRSDSFCVPRPTGSIWYGLPSSWSAKSRSNQ
mmetsp:Transcript_19230/g.59323  ORF Transcript_19230/g.59323 Transcript_19230/m.59323 type:complete len:282 (+) Transcript_19230:605-1450(+)